MIDIDLMGIVSGAGHGAKAVTGADVTTGVPARGYGATLYVLAFGALEDTLSYTLEDSDDNTNWTIVTGPVNGVESHTIVVEGVADTPVAILVRHSAVRQYHRMNPTVGTGDNFCAVVSLSLEPSQNLADTVDFILGS
jgi:hypothetical protein